jgi:hypothetical protein
MFVFALEVMWKIFATIISGLFALVIFLLREYYSRIREQRQRKQNLQPLVNDVTIRLGEVAERVDELWERQWELPFRELPFSEDDFSELKELANDCARISKDAGRAARDLVRTFQKAQDDIARQDRIVEMRARELMDIVSKPSIEDPIYGEYSSLVENQRYHLWADTLHDIEHALWKLARQIRPYSLDDSARRDLAEIAGIDNEWFWSRWFGERRHDMKRSFTPEGA